MWAAYLLYPAYRSKNGHVNTFAERLRGMLSIQHERSTAGGDPILVALETYSYWLAKGAPVGTKLPGQGFLKLPPPAQKADYARARRLYAALRAVPQCGRWAAIERRQAVFPALGARVRSTGARGWATSAMRPASSRPTCRSERHADRSGGVGTSRPSWTHDPQDPSQVQDTRAKFHDSPDSSTASVNGRVLGAP